MKSLSLFCDLPTPRIRIFQVRFRTCVKACIGVGFQFYSAEIPEIDPVCPFSWPKLLYTERGSTVRMEVILVINLSIGDAKYKDLNLKFKCAALLVVLR